MSYWVNAICRISLALVVAAAANTTVFAASDAALHRAMALGARGDLEAALDLLEETTEGGASLTDADLLRIDLLRRLGRLTQAEQSLRKLRDRLDPLPNLEPAVAAQLLHQAALLHLQQGDVPEAATNIASALELKARLPAALQASILNDAAIIGQRSGSSASAIAQFSEASRQVAASEAEVTYRTNTARALLEDGQLTASLAQAHRVSRLLEDSPTASTLRSRIALAALYRDAVNRYGADPEYRLAAFNVLQGAAREAEGSQRNLSLSNGFLAELYADDGQFEVALLYARVALKAAAQARAEDFEYRWEWVLAKAFAELGDSEAALAAYARAIASLRNLRSNLEMFDRNTLDDIIKPLYYEYADALLRHSAKLDNGSEKQGLLGNARAALEELKLAEVQDYFREQCVADETVLLDQLAVDTVVLYPVLLENRLELLLSTEAGIEQITVPIERASLVQLIRDFRLNIQANTGTDAHLHQGRRLYDLLVRPLEAELQRQRISTLVFVPDGPLRTIPLAALHDGESYLIERFAVATTPGLTLIDPKPFAGRSYSTLAGGISESVQGFPALPGVASELTAVENMFAAKVLANTAFTLARVESELQSGDYSIVHLATHGQFGDSYANSFLLTYDAKLQLNDLGRSIQSRAGDSGPLELLVLSACETAAGDDRAALGLAGVALKAGARSALATLWEVDDQSAVAIVREFYASLSTGGDSRARSLQLAQLQLIRNGRHSHPSQWAPFLLIGNWL